MSFIEKVSRRDFLRLTGIGAGALALGCHISPARTIKKLIKDGIPLNSFVSIRYDGDLVFISNRPEMGQGIRSSLATLFCDELGADPSRLRLEHADSDGPRFAIANQNPGGYPTQLIPEEVSQFADSSRSMAAYYLPIRLFGAGVRLVMVRAGAKFLRADPSECHTENHRVVDKKGNGVDFGHLLVYLPTIPVPAIPEIYAALKKPDQWTFIGKKDSVPFHDAHDMVTGKAVYCADIELPGMLTAMIERCPVANGDVKSFDASEALKVPGVRHVTKVLPDGGFPRGGVGAGFLPLAGVAVIADNTWAAWQGRRALKVEWDLSSPAAAFNANYDSAAFREELKNSTAQPGKVLRSKGDVGAALGVSTVAADYYVPHLAQAPMEPPVTIARFEDDGVELWSATQGPEITQHYVGLALFHLANPATDLVKWFAWQVVDPRELKECERKDQVEFNESLGKVLHLDFEGLIALRDQLKKDVRKRVKVHGMLLGGGFGRKSQPDFALEAAMLARQHPGVPIKVQWTREDDIRHCYYHGVSHQHLEASLGAGGRPTALLQRSAFSSFFASLFPPQPEIFQQARAAYHGGGQYPFGAAIENAQGLEDMPFDLDNIRIENCAAQSHTRVGWMRSVSNIFHAFSICSFADEMARAAGRDSKDYLLDLIGAGKILDLEAEGCMCFDNNGFASARWEGTPAVLEPYPPDSRRLRKVVERVAELSRWDAQQGNLPKGHGLGIAAHRSFLSYVAIVAHVSLSEKNELTIHEIFAVIDCGIAVNRDRVRAQMEGGIVYGLSYALLGEITYENGRVKQHNFDDYPVLRIHQAPKKFTLDIIDSQANPTGVGEPPTPAVAPALANAIVAAGGPRIRELPLWKFFTIR